VLGVYARIERAAGPASAADWPLKLTALVHELPPARIGRVLAAAGLADQARFVRAVVRGFGEVWRAGDARALGAFARRHGDRLRPLLLFEVAHEGAATPAMREAARRGGIERMLAGWVARLAHRARPDARRRAEPARGHGNVGRRARALAYTRPTAGGRGRARGRIR
jgi:hypothetical protein